ncbi:hypothetical protein N7G274_003626 [Stereocaulon virgatum]|uniref:Uncharacterized protein n=1 Tax=Stereocaulon virgatum TaxID=373712 RepID=A0ABR4ADX0_9LECA
MCQYLPGSEWYRDVITQNFQNPRKDKPITQWLSEWDQEFDDTSKSDWIRKKSRG